MNDICTEIAVRPITAQRSYKPGAKAWGVSLILITLGLIAGGVIAGPRLLTPVADQVAAAAPPVVTVSAPLQQDVNKRVEFLGQLAAVNQVELRAQVGGTLT